MKTNKKECLMHGCTRTPHAQTIQGGYLCEHHYAIMCEMGVKTMKKVRILECWEITQIKEAS